MDQLMETIVLDDLIDKSPEDVLKIVSSFADSSKALVLAILEELSEVAKREPKWAGVAATLATLMAPNPAQVEEPKTIFVEGHGQLRDFGLTPPSVVPEEHPKVVMAPPHSLVEEKAVPKVEEPSPSTHSVVAPRYFSKQIIRQAESWVPPGTDVTDLFGPEELAHYEAHGAVEKR